MNWHELNVNTHGRMSGQLKTECPNCQHRRQKHPHDKPLSVDLDEGIYNCHHCGWCGTVKENTRQSYGIKIPKKVFVKPGYKVSDESPNQKLLDWFSGRGITSEVVLRNRIEKVETWMSKEKGVIPVIAFPYFRDGEVVNVKYRSADKEFKMETGAELILYGMDDIDLEQPLIFVEGEIDKLSFEVAGFRNCVSVPNGAGTNLDMLMSAEHLLDKIKCFIWAGDNDTAGRKLEAEAIRRLGAERCWRVEWLDGCKDANDVLVKFGVEAIKNCLESSLPVPIEGAFEIANIMTDIVDLYDNGRPRGEYPGWDNVDEFYRPRLGDWTVITGSPGSGKSSWLAALMVNLAINSDWQFAVYPPENMPPQEYASMLMEIYAGQPFNYGQAPRMTREAMYEAAAWVDRHFVILNPTEGKRNLEGLLSLAKSYVLRRGIKGFVIDPWNELEHYQPGNQTETQYIGQSLIKIRQFARTYQLHVWVVAHPTKLTKTSENTYPVATLYDIAGSAHWYNKADMGISIWRDKADDTKPVEVHIQKVRFRWCGRLGMAQLYYDKITGRYTEHSYVSETSYMPKPENVGEYTQ